MTGLAAQQNSRTTIEDTQVPLYSKPAGSHVLTPIASGVTVYKNDKATLDASNTASGYIMVKYTGSVGKIKVQVSKSGSETYTYDLNSSGTYEVFPLSEGNGSYQVKVFENIQGTQYSQAFSQSLDVNITDTFGPFLYPNQYVNFNPASAAVQKGAELSSGVTDQIGVVTAIYNYVINNLTYDTAKAQSVQSGYLPNVDVVLAQKKGICFDYAALMTAMLRSQDIPTKLVVGYTGSLYHAWINVFLEGQGWVDNVDVYKRQVVNYVMGLSFITEGAIPFAAQDPLRVIPSCLIGSAIAGGLSMAFGCTLRAPHGGLFVLPTIGNPVMYLAAVVIGAVVGCVILGILKKNVEE